MRLVMPLGLLACGPAADFGLSQPSDRNEPGYQTIEIRADVALQRNNYGDTVSRCQIQIAFQPIYAEEEDTEETGEPAWTVAQPEEPGTCAFSVAPDPSEVVPGDPDDNWQISGSIAGPEQITLRGEEITLLLAAVDLGDGKLRYELPPEDCTDIDFPVGEVFDLEVPEGDTASVDRLPGFIVEDALVIGPDVWMTSPSVEGLEGDRMPHHADEDLNVRWELAGALPEVGGVPLAPEVELNLYNQDREQEHSSEWLTCLPEEDGRFTVPAEDLAQMTANAEPGGDRWFASVTVHTDTISPAFTAPWGESVQLRAHISEGGMILLHD